MNSELQDHHSDLCLCTNVSNNRRRRLVVAFDGTENEFGPEVRENSTMPPSEDVIRSTTNQSSHVVEFYSRIVKSGDQLSYYTSGIGTFVPPSSRARRPRMWIKNKWASMTARHFKSNILSGYRFLSDKYEIGDQIFLLGFSGGAYQARVLAAMIAKVGLLRTGNNEQIPFAFKMYTDPESSKAIPIVSKHPGLQGETTTSAKEFKKAFCYDVNIHFVGVWDTVSSVGAFRNKYYPGAERADNICFFRHALALDERRVKFIPEYVVAKREWFSAGEFGRPRCKEVWFRGFHSDVGGGHLENTTSDNGAVPSRWMAYEAMLAGLEMAPFWGGFNAKDLEPSIGKDSMTPIYNLLEYSFIKWESHSELRCPILTSDGEPTRHFSRAGHRKHPRQIFDHQKLHLSVCLHGDLSGTPFARLPRLWVDRPMTQKGWTELIKLLRDKDEAARAFKSNTTISLPREQELPSSAATERKYFRKTVRRVASNKSERSSGGSRQGSPGRQSLKDSASPRGGGMSDEWEVVQNTSLGEVLTEPMIRVPSRVHSPAAPSLVHSPASSPITSPITSRVPLRAPLPIHSRVHSPTLSPAHSLVAPSPITSPITSRVSPRPPLPIPSRDHSPVPSRVPSPVPSPVSRNSLTGFPEEAIEWDLLDYGAIPALIGGVLRGTNVNEFLERLEVLAYSDDGKKKIQESNGNQFSLMIRQLCGDKKYAEHTVLAIRLAYDVFWHSGVDLYNRHMELWKTIHSKVEGWDELPTDAHTSSLRRAVRLLHQTGSDNGLVEIRNTIIGMFNQWQQSFDERRSAPIQLCPLLETAVECNVQGYVLYLAVFASPHFSDARFTEKLRNRLVDRIKTASGKMKTLAMLCFCVFYAIDRKATLDEELFSALKPKFVEVGAPMEEMWEFVMPEFPFLSRGFGGNPEKMAGLKDLLDRFPEDLKQSDCSWARDTLDKAIIFQQNRQERLAPKPALPYRRSYGGMASVGPSVRGPSADAFGGPTPRLWWLLSPWEASASLPSAEVDRQSLSTRSSTSPSLYQTPTNEEQPLP